MDAKQKLKLQELGGRVTTVTEFLGFNESARRYRTSSWTSVVDASKLIELLARDGIVSQPDQVSVAPCSPLDLPS